MAIEGPIKELSLMDLFQLLAMSRKSGVLTLDCTRNVGQVFFVSGNIIRSTLQQGQEKLGQMMLSSGKLSKDQLDILLKEQASAKQKKKIGALAVVRGFATKNAVVAMLKTQVEETVSTIMGWQEGYFRFEDMELVPDPDLAFVQITENVIMEVSRRLDEWSKIQSKLPDLDMVLTLAPGSDLTSARLDLRPEEWLILANIDGQKTARQVIASVGGREFETAKVIYGLCATGLVKATALKGPLSLDIQEPVMDPIKAGLELIRRDQLEKAIETFSEILIKEPDSPLAHLYLAEAYFKTESFDEAIMEYKLASQGRDDNPEINYCLGFAYAKIGRLELAVERWERFLSFSHDDKRAGKIRELVDLAVRWAEGLEEKAAVADGRQTMAGFDKPAEPAPELSPEVKAWLERMKKLKERRLPLMGE
ncbi:MAG: DUF4388 domain-containing protein [Candidatus Edwardsbacteria bacterium]|nr:DUF4388 domain-containing protein [Candidatus Edwardsbacteria bacterium]